MNDNKYSFSDLELLRKKQVLYSRLIGIGIVGLIVSVWVLPFVWFHTGGWFVCILFYVIIAVVGKIVKQNRKTNKAEYDRAYKEVLVAPALASNFDTYTYCPEDGIGMEAVLNIGRWDRNNYTTFHTESEDLITGTYKGVYYEQSDLTINARLNRSEKQPVYYSGCVSKFRFKKHISEKLIVCTNIYSCPAGLSEVKTESVKFNNKFKVHATNDHDAFYILTPPFMEALLKLHDAMPRPIGNGEYIKRLWMLFENNTLYIIRDGVRVFEPPIGMQIDYFAEKERIIKDMRQLLDIVDILNLAQENKTENVIENKTDIDEMNGIKTENTTENNGTVAKFRLKC